MLPEGRKLLEDVLMAARRVRAKVADVSLDAFEGDDDRNDIVNWNLTIVGEAVAQLIKKDPSTAERIEHRRQIVSLRNQVVHGYAVIRRDMTWHIARVHVPALIREVEALLAE